VSDAVVEVRNVTHGFDGNPVLDDISMDIPKGKLTMITGLSGCGKTTLLKIMAGLLEPDVGSVYINGQDLFKLPRLRLFQVRQGMGFVFQDGALLSNLSVYDNIALPLRYHLNLPKGEIEEKVLTALENVSLAHYRHSLPGHLSVGQRKMVGVARALVMEPKIIFSDELVGITDAVYREQLINTMVRLRDDPEVTLVSMTHNIEMIKAYADFIGILHNKQLFAYAARDRIIHSRDPVLQRILSIIVDETEMIAESVLGIMEGDFSIEQGTESTPEKE
jgi:phospholipid/cholesterol/gamma-HCH transport system ATP-binding protein